MLISISRDDNIKIIELDGQIDVKTSDEVMEKVTALLDEKPTIISMGKVSYVSSSGLRALLMIAKKAKAQKEKQNEIHWDYSGTISILPISGKTAMHHRGQAHD